MTPAAVENPRLLFAGAFLSGRQASRSPIEDLAERFTQAGPPPVCASPFRNGLLRAAHMLAAAAVNRRRYDAAVVDLYSGRAFLWGEALSIALTMLRKPFVLALHGGALPEFARRHPQRVAACLRRAAAVTAPSLYLFESLRQFREDILLLPNPIELSEYRFRRRTRPAPKLVWVRAFQSVYNPALAPRAVALLASEFPDLELAMVGRDKDGSLERTRREAERLAVADRIRFPGGVPRHEVPRWLDEADVFLNTADVDNTPVSVLEALASGLCVVTTDAGGVPRLVRSEYDALVVPRNDAQAMAAAIRRVLLEPELGDRLSSNARLTAAACDWSVVFPKWRELLARVGRGGVRG